MPNEQTRPETIPCKAERDYISSYEVGTVNRDLSILMSHIGLTGIDPAELGGNHPDVVKQNHKDDLVRDYINIRTKPAPIMESAPIIKTAAKPNPKLAPKIPPLDPPKPAKTFAGVDLNPIEWASEIKVYMSTGGFSAAETGEALGYSSAYIQNTLRLLTLPPEVQDHVATGRLSASHGRAIATMRDPAAAARLIVSRNLSVRQTETLARRLRNVLPDGSLKHETAIPYTHKAKRFIEDVLGYKIRFQDRAGRGKIIISYKSPEQAQAIVKNLTSDYFAAGADATEGL